MIISFLVVAIILGFILVVKSKSYIAERRYNMKFQAIFNAHKEIGYPQLTQKKQFDILDNEDLSSVEQLTKHKFVPTGLLNYYLTILPTEYLEHLKSMNLTEEMKFYPNTLLDGFFIEEKSDSFYYIFIERNKIVFKKRFSTYHKLLNYLTYERLGLYAPKKYKLAWLKKYFA